MGCQQLDEAVVTQAPSLQETKLGLGKKGASAGGPAFVTPDVPSQSSKKSKTPESGPVLSGIVVKAED